MTESFDPAGRIQKPSIAVSAADAELIAVEALTFLSQDRARTADLFRLSGLDEVSIRSAAEQSWFLAGMLDHLIGDEALLVAFAAAFGRDPRSVTAARNALDPGAARESADEIEALNVPDKLRNRSRSIPSKIPTTRSRRSPA